MYNREKYINSPIEIKFELLYFFGKKENIIIFDIGACEAEDSIRYSSLFPKSIIYAFEPRKDNCTKAFELINNYKKTNIIFENIALSNENGSADFYLSEGEPGDLKNDSSWNYGNKSSSLLPPSDEMKKYTSWLSFDKKETVKTKRLDNYVSKKNISSIDFVHIDVQGAELMVLKGAGDFLKKIKLIWMEVEAVQLYKDQPLKNDIEKFMKSNNFINILDTVNDVSGDQLYVNRDYFTDEKINSFFPAKKWNYKMKKLKSLLNL